MNYLKPIAKVLVSILILYFVFSKINSEELWSVLRDVQWLYLIFAGIAFLASQFISSIRLNYFWRDVKLLLDWKYNWKLYLLGMYYNLLLPGGIGGDAYKMVLLSKDHGIPKKKLFNALIFDRLMGLLALGILLCLIISYTNPVKFAQWAFILIIPAILGFWFTYKKWFAYFLNSMTSTLLLSLLVQILQLVCAFFILLSLDQSTGILNYLSVFLLSSIAAVLPITFGGAGARELTFLYSAEYFDINVSVAIGLSLLFYILTFLISLAGIFYSFKSRIK